jgi:uncharacterized protein
MKYSGKTALITGASSGIGAAFARTLAQKGMNLILVARSERKLQTFSRELQELYDIHAEVIAVELKC